MYDSKFKTERRVDDAVTQNADYKFDYGARRYVDNQIRALQEWAVQDVGVGSADIAETGTLHDVLSTTEEGTSIGSFFFTGAGATVTGFANAASDRKIIIHAVGGDVELVNESSSSVEASRIVTGTGGNVTLNEGTAGILAYDASRNRWRLASGGGGGISGSADVADDIAKSVGTDIDRVRGINGLPLLNEDGDPAEDGDDPPPGGTWVSETSAARPGKPSPPGWYNAMWYGGLVENDSTSPAKAANKASVDAAIAAMSSNFEGSTLHFPEGIYYFPEEYTISKALTLRGVAGAGYYPKTVLVFPLVGRGLILAANFVTVKDIAIIAHYWEYGLGGHYWGRWNVSTAYALGAVVAPAQWSKWGYAFECIDAGTSGTSDAFFPGKDMQELLADRFIDLDITAATNATPIAVTTDGNHALSTGAEVIIEDVLGNTAANGQWTITVTGANTFTLDTSVGNGAYTSGGTVGWIFTDGGCIWRLRHCHAIDVCATKCIIDKGVHLRGFAGNGINITSSTADSRQTYASNLTVVDVPEITMCGGHGILIDGYDTSVFDIRTPNITDVGGFGVVLNPAITGKLNGAHIRDPQGGCGAWIDRCEAHHVYVEGGGGPIHRGGLGRVDSATPGSGPWDGFTDDNRVVWTANTAYVVGDVVRPTVDNGYYYYCKTAGTSAALPGDEPDWPTRSATQITREYVADGVGTLEWYRWGVYGNRLDGYNALWGLSSGPSGPLGGLNAGRGAHWRLPQNGTMPPLYKKIALFNTTNGGYIEQVGADDPSGETTIDLQYDPGSNVFYQTISGSHVAWFLGGGATTYFPAWRYCFPNGIGLGRANIDGSAFTNAYPGLFSSARPPIAGEYPQGVSAWPAASYFFHNAPTAGAPIGYRCLVAGDPGTWETLLNVRAPAVAMGALAVDWATGRVFTKTLAAGANVVTFSNAATGDVIIVRLTGAASTVTWPTVKWAGGVAPTQTASGTDVYTFVHDGTDIFGSVVQAMA